MLYRLRELMYEKYGEAKFALGCEIVSRWVNFEIRDLDPRKVKKWDQQHVVDMCNAQSNSKFPLSYEEAEAIRQIFGLSTINHLYNQ